MRQRMQTGFSRLPLAQHQQCLCAAQHPVSMKVVLSAESSLEATGGSPNWPEDVKIPSAPKSVIGLPKTVESHLCIVNDSRHPHVFHLFSSRTGFPFRPTVLRSVEIRKQVT